MEHIRNEKSALFEESEVTKIVGELWYRWENDIKSDLKEIRWDGVKLMLLAQDKMKGPDSYIKNDCTCTPYCLTR
jgi:hypothetical protein